MVKMEVLKLSVVAEQHHILICGNLPERLLLQFQI